MTAARLASNTQPDPPTGTARRALLSFYGSGLCVGALTFLTSLSLFPHWMKIKPSPSWTTRPLINTCFESIAWLVPVAALYVPDMLFHFAAGLIAGILVRHSRLTWIAASVSGYVVLSIPFGGSIWSRAAMGILYGNLQELNIILLCVVIVSPAFAGALIGARVARRTYSVGQCDQCGYDLRCLTSFACPECGKEIRAPVSTIPIPPSPFSHQGSVLVSKRPIRIAQCLERHPFLFRTMVAILLSLSYSAFDWMPLRTALCELSAWVLRMSNHVTAIKVSNGSPSVCIGENCYVFGSECTYVQLVMLVSPFLWVSRAATSANLLRIIVVATIIQFVNAVRTTASVYFNATGVVDFYAHDLPDLVLWWTTAILIVVLSLRREYPHDARGDNTKFNMGTTPISNNMFD